MAALNRAAVTLTGVTLGAVAAAVGGDTFANDGNTVFYVKNAGASPVTVTIDSIKLSNYGTDVNPSMAVGAGAEMVIGPFPVARFGRTVTITYSGVTSVTVAPLQISS